MLSEPEPRSGEAKHPAPWRQRSAATDMAESSSRIGLTSRQLTGQFVNLAVLMFLAFVPSLRRISP